MQMWNILYHSHEGRLLLANKPVWMKPVEMYWLCWVKASGEGSSVRLSSTQVEVVIGDDTLKTLIFILYHSAAECSNLIGQKACLVYITDRRC